MSRRDKMTPRERLIRQDTVSSITLDGRAAPPLTVVSSGRRAWRVSSRTTRPGLSPWLPRAGNGD